MKKILYFLVIITIIFSNSIFITGCTNMGKNETPTTEITKNTATTPTKSTEISTVKTEKHSDIENITLDEAKKIALNHAEVAEASVTFTQAKLDTDDGRKIYEIDFNSDNTEYDYDIDATTGKIISSEKDIEKVSATTANSDINRASVLISSDQALKIALADAKTEENSAAIKPVDLDAENGVQYYDVTFRVGNIEYEYEINAKTGEIISSDID